MCYSKEEQVTTFEEKSCPDNFPQMLILVYVLQKRAPSNAYFK